MRIMCNSGEGAPGSAPVDVVAVFGPDDGLRAAWAGAFARAGGGVLISAERHRDDEEALPRTVRLLRSATRPCRIVLEVAADGSALDVIGECTDPDLGVPLRATVLVADADDVEGRLLAGGRRARALLEAVEACSHQALRGPAEAWPPVLRALQPTAVRVEGDPRRLLGGAHGDDADPLGVAGAARPLGPERDEAGWLRVINDQWPAGVDPARARVVVFRHERHRPLHGERWERLTHRWGSRAAEGAGVRLAGLCRLSTRPSWTCRWDQLGPDADLQPLVHDDDTVASAADDDESLGCLGDDLAVFAWGPGWDAERMRAELDEASLTDAEFLGGPAAW